MNESFNHQRSCHELVARLPSEVRHDEQYQTQNMYLYIKYTKYHKFNKIELKF